jgi:hypothetical protein
MVGRRRRGLFEDLLLQCDRPLLTSECALAEAPHPGYRRDKEIRRPKLDGFTGIIDQILDVDKLVPKKQRHTSKRFFERLRNEHDFTGGITIVKDYIFAARQRQRENMVKTLTSGAAWTTPNSTTDCTCQLTYSLSSGRLWIQ